MKKADIALVGLAVMGENLVMNMESKGFTVAVYNRTTEKVKNFVEGRGAGKNIIAVLAEQAVFLLQCLNFPDAVENIALVQIAQLDIGNIICLNFVNVKALHQVGNNLRFFLGLTDDANGFIDVKQNFAKAEQKMKLVLLFAEIECKLAAQTSHTELYPLTEYLDDTHLSRC